MRSAPGAGSEDPILLIDPEVTKEKKTTIVS